MWVGQEINKFKYDIRKIYDGNKTDCNAQPFCSLVVALSKIHLDTLVVTLQQQTTHVDLKRFIS